MSITNEPPTRITGVAGDVQFGTIALGHVGCGLTPLHELYCWTPPNGTAYAIHTPRQLLTLTGGSSHVCGLDAEGYAYCWEASVYGPPQPRLVTDTLRFVTLKAGNFFTCGLLHEGAAVCWGANEYGQTGAGSTTHPWDVIVRVAGGHRFTALAAGGHVVGLASGSANLGHSCALTPLGEAFCWGSNVWGELGTQDTPNCGNIACSSTPVPATIGMRFSRIAASTGLSCATDDRGALYCWGDAGDRSSRVTSINVGVASLAERGPCGIFEDGSGFCVRRVDGSSGTTLQTVPEAEGLRLRQLHVAPLTSCALTTDGFAYCWGLAIG